jgi:hypothetical protein
MFLSGFVLVNDPRTSLPHFIFLNVYWVWFATESINEIYVNSFKDECVVKWNEHFTESAIFSLRQCCIYKVGNPLVESSGFYIEVID